MSVDDLDRAAAEMWFLDQLNNLTLDVRKAREQYGASKARGVLREGLPWGNRCVLCVAGRLGRQLDCVDFVNDPDPWIELLRPPTPLLARRRGTPDANGFLHKAEILEGDEPQL